jgi:serine/threonine protein kinase
MFCQDFVQRLLVLDPEQRLTVSQALRHSWLIDNNLKHRVLVSAPTSLKYVNNKRALKV